MVEAAYVSGEQGFHTLEFCCRGSGLAVVERLGGEGSRPVGGGRGGGGAAAQLPQGGAQGGALRAKRKEGDAVAAGKQRAVEGACKHAAADDRLPTCWASSLSIAARNSRGSTELPLVMWQIPSKFRFFLCQSLSASGFPFPSLLVS